MPKPQMGLCVMRSSEDVIDMPTRGMTMSTPAGWYEDPENPGQQRYWDGQQWTDQRQPAVPAPPVPPAMGAISVGNQAEPPRKHTTRNVILAVIGVFILLVGGCTIALVAAGGKAVNDAIDDMEESDNAPGGPNNPMEIQLGEAFEVQGFNYADGWSVKNVFGSAEVKNLKVTNNREEKDSAIVEIKFWDGTEVLALLDCTTSPIDPGTTQSVSCISADKLPANYDKITINDTF